MASSPGGSMHVRDAVETETDALAQLWYSGWHDGHAAVVPAELTRLRTLASFHERMRKAHRSVRVIGPIGEPLGFSIIRRDELYQFYVAAAARGTGVATVLLADAEDRLAERAIKTAWLACAIGNDRAARFYEKSGWQRIGTMTNRLATPAGPYLLEVWRYQKVLRHSG